MTEQQPKHSIKTVEVLQIAAGLTAALRWAIALMPLDGMRFALNEREWFEPVSFGLSLAFAAVEIGATAYIMRAWRKETDKPTQAALMLLWMVALALMVVAQVPPLIANIDGVSVATFSTLLKVVWVTCGVSVTFVVIGGVGYAEKSLEAQPTASTPQVTDEDCHCPICRDVIGLPVWLFEQHGDKYLAYCDKCERAYTEAEVAWLPSTPQVGASLTQPLAQGPQVGETDGIGTLDADAGQDTALESPQQAKTGGTQVLDAEPVESIVVDKEPLKSPVLSAVTFDGYQLTGDTRRDLRALLAIAPLATNASLARKLLKSDERVRQLRLSLSQEALAKAMQ